MTAWIRSVGSRTLAADFFSLSCSAVGDPWLSFASCGALPQANYPTGRLPDELRTSVAAVSRLGGYRTGRNPATRCLACSFGAVRLWRMQFGSSPDRPPVGLSRGLLRFVRSATIAE
jgi:hypothetical protein